MHTSEYYDVPIILPSKITAAKGAKPTSLVASYTVNNEDSGDDIQFHLCKRVLPADGVAMAAISTIAGDADVDYENSYRQNSLLLALNRYLVHPDVKYIGGVQWQDLEEFEEELEAMGAPWTPGRIPVWRAD